MFAARTSSVDEPFGFFRDAANWTPGGDRNSSAELEVRLRPSPVGEGTALTMRLGLPADGMGAGTPEGAIAGALVVKTLYRTKALFETGEVPTLEKNPSA